MKLPRHILVPVLTAIITMSCVASAANNSVQVSATVGAINQSPIITSVNPAGDPKMLPRSNLQNYAIYFTDTEKDTVYYTVTPTTGFSTPTSGTISSADYDSGSGAYINFSYLAPSSVPGTNPTTVVVTLNDGPNLVNRNLRVYIY